MLVSGSGRQLTAETVEAISVRVIGAGCGGLRRVKARRKKLVGKRRVNLAKASTEAAGRYRVG